MKQQYLAYADWSSAEYAAIARSLLHAQVNQGTNISALLARLTTIYQPSSVYLVNFGHLAIQIALRIFRRHKPQHNEVIVPAFICPSVVKAIIDCGLIPVSVDIESNLNLSPNAMQAAFGPSTLAVIAPHMYGCPADIVQIERICQRANVFLIDDAAQVMGVSCQGRLLGTFGDAGIISFAQSKTIVTGIRGSGGVLLINKPEYAAHAKLEWDQLPASSNRIGSLIDFLWNFVWSAHTGHSAYYLGRIGRAMGWRQSQQMLHHTKISNLEAGIALEQLKRLDSILQEKIRISRLYHEGLQKHPLIEFPQYAPERFLARVMLCLPEGIDVARFRALLEKKGLQTRTGYDAYLSPQAKASRAQNLAHRLLGVPSRAGMRDEDIFDICQVIGDSLDD